MPSLTERLARASSRRPWVTVGAWLVALVVAFVCIGALLGSAITTDRNFTNNPESDRADALLAARLPDPNAVDDIVLVRSASLRVDDPEFRNGVEELYEQIRTLGVTDRIGSYYLTRDESLVSRDRDATILPLVMAGSESEAEENIEKVVGVVEDANEEGGLEVLITGEFTSDLDRTTLSEEDLQKGEFFFGIPVALVILVLVFGALVGAFLPLILAVGSIIIALGIVALIGQVAQLNLFVINMLTGMGLALGIDYALFVLTRYREERSRGREKLDAIGMAGATSSRAVFFSGLAFVVALLGMMLVPDTLLRSLAFGAILVGTVAVIAALTLLPAVLSLLGDRVNSLRVPVIGRNIVASAGGEGRFWSAVARQVMRRPVVSLVLAVGLLIAASIPVLDLKIGESGISTYPDDLPSKQGFLALDEEFGAGRVDPADIVVDGDIASSEVQGGIDRLRSSLATDEVFAEPTLQVNETDDLALLSVPLAGDATADEAYNGVRKLRDDLIPQAFSGVDAEVLVTGGTAASLDYSDLVKRWLPIILTAVFVLSLILLTVAFHSIVVPIKAVILNLLSVGAAYGLVILVFQKGVGADLLGFQQVDAVEAWVPPFLFSVLFALSMDYHVFLLSRIRERFSQTGNNREAVAFGIGTTARLITGAALIMMAVFTGFAIGDLVMFQQMGFGLAVALLLDATIVRSVLVPAAMALLDERNWYLPSWLSWIPDVHIEGERPPTAPPAPKPG